MRKLGTILAVSLLGVWLAGSESARGGADEARISRSATMSFRLASASPIRDYDPVTFNGSTLFVSRDTAFTNLEVVSAALNDASTGLELKLTDAVVASLSGGARVETGDQLAVYIGRRLVAAGSFDPLTSDGRTVLSGLPSTLAGRLANLLAREASVFHGAVFVAVPSRSHAFPGETITVDAYIENARDVGAYQVKLTTGGGETGSLTLEDLSVDDRADSIFGSSAIKATDSTQFRLLGALMGGGVDADSRAYLGSFILRLSPDATGTFTVNVEAGQETILTDSNAVAIPHRMASAATITVAGVEGKAARSRE